MVVSFADSGSPGCAAALLQAGSSARSIRPGNVRDIVSLLEAPAVPARRVRGDHQSQAAPLEVRAGAV
jgi:hypothetical protein